MYNTFEELEESIKGCNKCKLYKTRQNIVFGVGKKDARLMFIGDGPGSDDSINTIFTFLFGSIFAFVPIGITVFVSICPKLFDFIIGKV